MPITKSLDGTIVYSEPTSDRLFSQTGSIVDEDFAIIDRQNQLKQVQFRVIPTTTSDGVLTLQCDVGANNTLVLSNMATINPLAGNWYVDQGRTDSYVETGTFQYPYKTIMGAVNAIIASGLNSPSHPDCINIVGTGFYNEDVTLNDSALNYIVINSKFGTSVASLSSTANNTQLASLYINNLLVIGNMTLIGDTNNTNFLGGNLYAVDIEVDGAFVLTNARFATLLDSRFVTTTAITNLFSGIISGGQAASSPNSATFTLTHDNAQNKPAGLGSSGTTIIIDKTLVGNYTVSAGASLTLRGGSRIGISGGTSTIAGTVIDAGSLYRGNISVSAGGVWQPTNCSYFGTLTNSGTVTTNGNIQANAFSGDSGSGGKLGLVPAAAAGDAAANKFVYAGGGWATPTSTMVTNLSGVTGSTVTAAMNTLQAGAQEILLSAIKNAGSVTANTTVPTWTTVTKDTNSAFNASTGVFTVPVAGDYKVVFSGAMTVGTPIAQVYKNGTLVQTGLGSLTRTAVRTVIPNCAVNDTITVAFDTTGTLTSTTTDTILSIYGIAGYTTGIVNARYHGATATITSSLSNVTFTTKDFDTNSAYSGATFTAPSSGVYSVSASLSITAVTVAAGATQVLQLNKNGSQYGNYQFVSASSGQKPAVLTYRDLVFLTANDTLVFQVSSSSTTPTVTASNFYNFLSITKISN